MKLSAKELTEGMQGALNKVKGIFTPTSGTNDTDEKRKKMLGSGMAANTAQTIIDRKKAMKDALGE